jgi:hypothetical protein
MDFAGSVVVDCEEGQGFVNLWDGFRCLCSGRLGRVTGVGLLLDWILLAV